MTMKYNEGGTWEDNKGWKGDEGMKDDQGWWRITMKYKEGRWSWEDDEKLWRAMKDGEGRHPIPTLARTGKALPAL